MCKAKKLKDLTFNEAVEYLNVVLKEIDSEIGNSIYRKSKFDEAIHFFLLEDKTKLYELYNQSNKNLINNRVSQLIKERNRLIKTITLKNPIKKP